MAVAKRPVSESRQMGLMIRTSAEADLIALALESLKNANASARTVVMEDLLRRVSSLQTYFKSLASLEAIKKASERRNAQTRKIGPSYEQG